METAMLIDLTLPITPERVKFIEAQGHAPEGHICTHFDVMNKEFPLESFRTRGRLIDISALRDREIEIADIESHGISEGDTVIFHTGYMDELGYDNAAYWRRSAELSDAAVGYLLDRRIRLIAIDAAGAQKPKKHKDVDQLCADNGVFIVENLDNVKALLGRDHRDFTVFTAPLKHVGYTGLPCRVIVEI
jgi:kynurenine formamidase